MQISTETYADFVTAVKAVAGVDVVLYYDNSPTTFTIYAICGGRKIRVNVPSLTSKPGAFDTDFPDAIQMTSNFSMGA
jgi:hypothetical protein